MKKIIVVDDILLKRLGHIKVEYNLRSFKEVINYLLNNQKNNKII